MKIDHEYLKGLLEAFEASEGPQTDIKKLKKQGFDYATEEFLFHMRLLDDRGSFARATVQVVLGSPNQSMAMYLGLLCHYD